VKWVHERVCEIYATISICWGFITKTRIVVFNTIDVYYTMVVMATISIKEKTRKELLQIAADLQKIRQERVDFDTVIQYLIALYSRQKFDLDAWRTFTQPIPNTSFEEMYTELLSERRLDNGNR